MIVAACLVFGLVLLVCALAWRFASQRDKAVRSSIDWQFEKSRKVAGGWRPSLGKED